jgi:hypothetical protein
MNLKNIMVCPIIVLLLSGCLYGPATRVWLTYSGPAPAWVGQTIQIESTLSSPDASLSWSVSDTYPVSAYPETRVASVDSSGLVTLHNYGSFTVLASTGDFTDSISFTFYADPALNGTWTNGPETLVLHRSGVLEQPASTQSGAWYSTETQIFLEYLGSLVDYTLIDPTTLWIDLNGDSLTDAGETFNAL